LDALLYNIAYKYYCQVQEVRLNPYSSQKYAAENIQLNKTTSDSARVVLLGDSRISHWQPLPSLAGCLIVNRGVSGETTGQTLLRLEKDVVSLKPSLAVIQVGINDIKAIGVFPKQRQRIIDSCGHNIKTMLERLTAKGISVIVMTVVPPGRPQLLRRLVWSDAIYSAVCDVNDAIRAMGNDKVVVFDCDTFMSDDKKIKPQYACDTLHFSRRGYEELNKYLEPVLTVLIESLNN